MSLRNFIVLLALMPAMAFAQKPDKELQRPPEADGGPTHSAHPADLIVEPSADVLLSAPNALTMQVIMAQKHTGISDEQWLKMMLEPVNATLYPIRLTQAMLDTLDATQLDARYRYELVR